MLIPPEGNYNSFMDVTQWAYITEQAGGKASDGYKRTMEIEVEELHQRLYIYWLNGYDTQSRRIYVIIFLQNYL
ncbi:hypothetical protein [Mucilaginibacter sp. R-33]|uniref:hypothetical protein n=1 Tax=Mucilaginibacter sp. R-33 TaxID=3416711 RepID=UPI003CEBA002